MIKILVELWPHGYSANKRMLGMAEISNDLTGTVTKGNYGFRIWGTKKLLASGKVKGFPRKRLGVWYLITLILLEFVKNRKEKRHGRKKMASKKG